LIEELIVDVDERVGGGGFLEIRRLRLRNRHSDGSISAQYICDSIARPYGQDAVVVAIYARREGRIDVLVRDGLRPAIFFGRDPAKAPEPEAPPAWMLTELVAGILEEGDRGLATRAAHEVFEEAGFVVAPEAIVTLGNGVFPSPGSMVEKFYFVAVEVDPAAQQAPGGDGSPMEEGATTRWLPLGEAIATAVDLKTELGLRRLRDLLDSLPR
jgi:ADP-ribose pyrophosphatase